MEESTARKPTLIQSLIPIIFLIALLSLNVIYFGDATLDGANQFALILSAAIAGLIAIRLRIKWDRVREQIVKSIGSAMPSMLILLMIGALAGTWMISGVVPTLIYYGLKIFHPSIFLFATVIIGGVVSLATGSSWSTIATMGIALVGIGKTLGISEGVVAGAVISGAYFGDKMSPLSDTTNLAPAMAGTDLFTHIRYMVYTTVPSLLISLIIFLVIGFNSNFSFAMENVGTVKTAIEGTFNTSPLLFLVPIILLTIIILKVPPLPALLAGTLLGGIFAVIFQPEIVKDVAGIAENYTKASYISVMQAMFGDVTLVTTDENVNELLSTSGMRGMLDTVWLILSAMVFGGVMESAGLLQRITRPIVKYAKSTGSLVASTVGTCLFFNTTASDQYIAIVVPGRID